MHLKEKLQKMEDDCKFTLVTIDCSKAWQDEHFEVKARVVEHAWTSARGRARGIRVPQTGQLTCFVFTFQCVQNFPSLLSISRLGI